MSFTATQAGATRLSGVEKEMEQYMLRPLLAAVWQVLHWPFNWPKENFRVIVIEKETYPFHRVCGEYISFESWNFLENIGYPLSDLDLPVIKNLQVSAPNGNMH